MFHNFGSHIQGDSGFPLEAFGASMYSSMGGKFDIIIPDTRGTGRSTLLRCSSSLSMTECQKSLSKSFADDASLAGFSVNEIAYDIIDIIRSVQQPGQVTYLYGLNFGSYIIDRVLRFSPSIANAVVMDGVCTYPTCNATDTDVFVNSMGIQILAQCTQNNTICKERFNTPQNLLNSLQEVRGRYSKRYCGLLLPETVPINRTLSTLAIHDPNIQVTVPASLARGARCDAYDATAIFAILQYTRKYVLTALDPLRSDVLYRHIILSEFSDNLDVDQATKFDNSATFTTFSRSTLAKQKKAGWISYTRTLVPENTYNGPILRLNGDLDPNNPLSRIQNISNVIVFNGVGYNTWANTRTSNPNVTCAHSLITQFFESPSTTLNTSCLNDLQITPFSSSSLFKNDAWNAPFAIIIQYPYAPVLVFIIHSTLFICCIIVLIGVTVFYNKQPVRSRFIAPYVGLLTLLHVTATNIYGGAMSLLSQHSAWGELLNAIGSALIMVTVVAFSMQSVRFYILRYLYQNMSTSPSHTKQLLLLKMLTSNITFIVVLVATVILWAGLYFLAYFYEGAFSAITYTEFACALVILIILLILFAIDLVFISKVCKNNFLNAFFVDDPLLFRVDTAMLLISFAFFILYNFLTGVVDSYTYNIFQLFAYGFGIMFSGGTVCIGVLVGYIRGIRPKQHSDKLDKNERLAYMLQDAKGRELVSKYARAEFSYENVAIVIELNEILPTFSEKTDMEKYQLVDNIVNTYLDRTSTMEVNVPALVRQAVIALHQRQAVETTQGEGQKIMEELHNAAVVTLLDTYSRYEDTRECKHYWTLVKTASNLKIDA